MQKIEEISILTRVERPNMPRPAVENLPIDFYIY